MSYRIEQDEIYLGHDRWKWSAWIEAPPQELNQVELVTWILHATFNPSRVESRSRENKFRLDTSGWGTFLLRAQLQCKGQSETLVISRMLKLSYPDEEAPSEATKTSPTRGFGLAKRSEASGPLVFLSYSSEDKLRAHEVRLKVEKLGARVVDASAIGADLPLEASIRKMIRESDAVMSVVGSDYVSPWVLAEMKMAQAEEKPTITMLSDEVSWPSGLSRDVQIVRLGENPNVMESNLAEFVGKLTS